uniref:Uncharacterized protein n=1 Tax=Picea sitchensis TaxID=3332 RepID=A9NYK0_PICSI|nr:unknown [Picea sitchensis]
MAPSFAMVLPSSISVCCINNHNCKREIACHHPSPISVKPEPTYFCKSTSSSLHCRRKVLQSTILSALLLQPVLSPNWVAAEEENSRKNDLIERLLQKSKANKAKYAKERLDDYYKRNYKDYFEFVEGSVKQGELSEAEKGILEWLRKNR